jgi:hypothetical protein
VPVCVSSVTRPFQPAGSFLLFSPQNRSVEVMEVYADPDILFFRFMCVSSVLSTSLLRHVALEHIA